MACLLTISKDFQKNLVGGNNEILCSLGYFKHILQPLFFVGEGEGKKIKDYRGIFSKNKGI